MAVTSKLFFSTLQSKMQVDEDQQKAQDNEEKEDGEKKAESEEMEVIPDLCWTSRFPYVFYVLTALSCAD